MLSSQINTVKKICDDLYVITETDSINCYLLIGNERALLIDCGYGYEDINPILLSITNKPIIVALTHGDPDHGLGVMNFKDFLIHPLDYGKLLDNDNPDVKGKMLTYRFEKNPKLICAIDYDYYTYETSIANSKPHFIKDGQIIDLGDKHVKIFHTPGHSYGHVMYLEMETGRLFTGDQLSRHNIWHFMSSDSQGPFYTTLKSLKRIYNYNSIIKELYPAHDVFPCGIELLEDLIDCLGNELPLNYLNDIPFHHSMGNGYQHRYKSVNLIYSDERLSEYLNKEIIR